MATITRTEKRKRGIFGKLFLLCFWIFNGLMAWWMVASFGAAGEAIGNAADENVRAGAAIGSALATGVILTIWMAGAVILGLLVLMTPGKTVITETRAD